jgi:hypothetical protein
MHKATSEYAIGVGRHCWCRRCRLLAPAGAAAGLQQQLQMYIIMGGALALLMPARTYQRPSEAQSATEI